MSVPAPRPAEDDQPLSLEELGARYSEIDRHISKQARWRTRPGQDFLHQLRVAAQHYSVLELSTTLGITKSGLVKMLNVRMQSTFAYPDSQDVRTLQSALRRAQATGGSRKRATPEYLRVYDELQLLLMQFELADIAFVCRLQVQKLRPYTTTPMARLVKDDKNDQDNGRENGRENGQENGRIRPQ